LRRARSLQLAGGWEMSTLSPNNQREELAGQRNQAGGGQDEDERPWPCFPRVPMGASLYSPRISSISSSCACAPPPSRLPSSAAPSRGAQGPSAAPSRGDRGPRAQVEGRARVSRHQVAGPAAPSRGPITQALRLQAAGAHQSPTSTLTSTRAPPSPSATSLATSTRRIRPRAPQPCPARLRV